MMALYYGKCDDELQPPFSTEDNDVICKNGHVCSCDNPQLARFIAKLLNDVALREQAKIAAAEAEAERLNKEEDRNP